MAWTLSVRLNEVYFHWKSLIVTLELIRGKEGVLTRMFRSIMQDCKCMNAGHHEPNCAVQSRVLGLGEFYVNNNPVELVADKGFIWQ